MFYRIHPAREISIACEKLELKPSIMLSQIERPALVLMGNGTYKYIDNLKGSIADLFNFVDYTREDFETIASDVNERERARRKGVSQYHRTPDEVRRAHARLKKAIRGRGEADEPAVQAGRR